MTHVPMAMLSRIPEYKNDSDFLDNLINEIQLSFIGKRLFFLQCESVDIFSTKNLADVGVHRNYPEQG
jgi:hypothetical protein